MVQCDIAKILDAPKNVCRCRLWQPGKIFRNSAGAWRCVQWISSLDMRPMHMGDDLENTLFRVVVVRPTKFQKQFLHPNAGIAEDPEQH